MFAPEMRSSPIVVDLGHMTSECEIDWADPHLAYRLIQHRCMQLLAHVRDTLQLRPRSLTLHMSRPLHYRVLDQISADGRRQGVDVSRELSRQRGAYRLVPRLRRMAFSVPSALVLSPSVYHGVGIHPARGARLQYVTDHGGKRPEPVVEQSSVDMQIAMTVLQRTIMPVHHIPALYKSKDIVLMTVDDDLLPVMQVMQEAGIRCHVVHYSAAIVSRLIRETAASVTDLPGWRRPIPRASGGHGHSVLNTVVI
jgi:hypothetical protein